MPPMLSLMLATLGQTLFGLVLRHGQRRSLSVSAMGAVNYVTCAVAFALLTGRVPLPSASTLIIGTLGGFSYVVAYFLFVGAMNLRGVSVTVALARLSVLIPILFSIILWAERPNLYQLVGVAFALLSLGLLSAQPGCKGIWSRELLVPIALFFVNGGCGLAVKAFQEAGLPEEDNVFFFVLFSAAALASGGVWLRSPLPCSWKDLTWGIILGCCNALGNFFLLLALQSLPGVVVFPIVSSLGLLLTVAFASVAWRERLRGLAFFGIVLAIAAVALINLK